MFVLACTLAFAQPYREMPPDGSPLLRDVAAALLGGESVYVRVQAMVGGIRDEAVVVDLERVVAAGPQHPDLLIEAMRVERRIRVCRSWEMTVSLEGEVVEPTMLLSDLSLIGRSDCEEPDGPDMPSTWGPELVTSGELVRVWEVERVAAPIEGRPQRSQLATAVGFDDVARTWSRWQVRNAVSTLADHLEAAQAPLTDPAPRPEPRG